MIKKIFALLTNTEEREEYDETKHKLCDECGGGGIDFIAGPCSDCGGNGFINKERAEMWKDNINLK